MSNCNRAHIFASNTEANNKFGSKLRVLIFIHCVFLILTTPLVVFAVEATSANIKTTTEAPVLYIVSMMHAEDNVAFYDNKKLFNKTIESLEKIDILFNLHNAKNDMGPDWAFVLADITFESDFLTEHLARGHGVHTHAHENTIGYDLEGVNDLLIEAGLSENIIANGGFDKTYPPNQNWVGYIASILDSDSNQRFTTVIGYKDAVTQVSDSAGIIFRPSLVGDWRVHDPDSPLIYIGSNTDEVDHGIVLDFDTIRGIVDDRLTRLQPNKINTLYWHDSMHNYINPTVAAERIILWRQLFNEYFDPLLADGKIEWKTFEEMTLIYLEQEELIFVDGFE